MHENLTIGSQGPSSLVFLKKLKCIKMLYYKMCKERLKQQIINNKTTKQHHQGWYTSPAKNIKHKWIKTCNILNNPKKINYPRLT